MTTEFLLFFSIPIPLSSQNSSWYTVCPQKYLLNKFIQNEFILSEWKNDSTPGPKAHPVRKNKIGFLLAFVWNWRGWHSTQPKYSSDWLDILCQCVEDNIPLDFTLHFESKTIHIWKKISLPVSSLQNPLTAWVFLATEITSDYSVKCSSGENCMFRDACNVQLSNIHTVTILKERAQCREMGNTIKALGCTERRRPKESLLTYLIPGMGN